MKSSVSSVAGIALIMGVMFTRNVRADQPDSTPTYTRDVAKILWTKCATCHRPGEVAPFSLLRYDDAAKRADQLAEVIESRTMPPWKPEPNHGEFLDVRRLSDDEIKTMVTWAKADAPEGDPRDLPPAPHFTDGWQLGEPDLVLTMPETFHIPADGRDVYQAIVIPTGVETMRFVSAVEFRPGNRQVAHHALFFLDNTGTARQKDVADPGPGYRSFGGPGFLPTGALGGWAPGVTPRFLPDGTGRILMPNSDLVLLMHYHPRGKPENDQSRVGIHFSKRITNKAFMGIPLGSWKIDIAAGESHHRIAAESTLPTDIHLYGIAPHMHLIGREMKVTATLPDGEIKPLIWIKDWDFNWQDQYLYAEPIALPKGTRFDMYAIYDNSDENPFNPNSPPQRVLAGEQTTDEMCLCFLQVVPDHPQGYGEILRAIVTGKLGSGRPPGRNTAATPAAAEWLFRKWLGRSADDLMSK